MERLRILVAEDNPINQKITQLQFKQIGLICDIASNGEEAVDMQKRENYNVILMDLQMPVLNGIEATQLIRQFEQQNDIKKSVFIVAVTANAFDDDRSKCLDAGMDDYATKPMNIEMIKDLLERAVNQV